MDVGGKCTGTISGMMNMAGNIGGALSPIVFGLPSLRPDSTFWEQRSGRSGSIPTFRRWTANPHERVYMLRRPRGRVSTGRLAGADCFVVR